MKFAIVCLGLAAWPALAGSPRIRTAPVTLYTQFHQGIPPAVEEALRDELKIIMEPMGVTFEWRSLSSNRGEVSVELAVLTFKGRCDAADLPLRQTVSGALGWTHMSDGAILPFSEVDCNRMREFIGKGLLAFDLQDREEAMGRAMARVVAHELYHIFAETTRHGAWGVGKAAYTVEELLSYGFRFEEEESRALRTSKAHAAVTSGGTQ
jgi:hypothetical protein